MRSATFRISLASFLVIISCYTLSAQVQKTSKVGATVSGRVTIKGKGVPAVAVSLRKAEMNSPFESMPRATTDQDGNYKISNIAAGAYDVFASTPGYVMATDGPTKRVVLAETENIENINFSLVRGGVITGKVRDADSRPVVLGQVRLYRVEERPARSAQPTPQTEPAFNMANSEMTDDRGVYRFFGLRAGKYIVAVGRDSQGFNYPTRVNYKEVFYPDVQENAKATVLEVSEGSEAKDIDITIGRPLEAYSASGRVIDAETGEGIPNVRFTLQQIIGDRGGAMNAFVVSNSRGDFVAENLATGKYVVYIFQEPNSSLRADNATFEVNDADVTGITIRMVKGGSISGVVFLESENKEAFARLAKLQVTGYVQPQNDTNRFGINSSRALIGVDGSFRLGGLAAGIARIQVAPTSDMSDLKGFIVTRVERDGAVLPTQGFEIRDGEQVTGVRIVLTYGTATLRGVVNIENGPLPPGARIMVRLIKPGEVAYALRQPSVDERGHFLVDGVPPGAYEVSVSVSGLKKPPQKQNIVLQDNAVTDLTIIYALDPQPNP